jgi:hypothetical protein
MNLSRQETLRIIQEVHAQWWSEHPELDPEQAGDDEAEQELFNRIEQALAQAREAKNYE